MGPQHPPSPHHQHHPPPPSNLYPAFGLRSPLGAGFRSSNASPPVKGGMVQSYYPSSQSTSSPTRSIMTNRSGSTSATAASRGNVGGGGPGGSLSVEEEYIRNLQQQVYLLELETRYLRNGKGEGEGGAKLVDIGQRLKIKYVELQETHKKEMQKMEELMDQLPLNLQAIEKDREDLKKDLKNMRDHQNTEKDRLYGELLALRKKAEITASEHQRLEKTHSRFLAEKQQLESAAMHAQEDARKYRDQVEELLHINATLKIRVEELHKANTIIQSRLEDHEAAASLDELDACKARIAELVAERTQLLCEAQQAETLAKQEEHLRMRISQDCADLVKANVTLKAELENVQRRLKKELEYREQKVRRKQDQLKEADDARHDLGKLKDDYAMQKIALDNKDRKINEITAQIKSMEHSITIAMDMRSVLEDRLAEMESRVRTQENELIQIGQDKSLLIDDVAELRNTTELKNLKIASVLKENQELQVQIEKFTREMSARKEFSHLIHEIESSGDNYLHLMRNMRNYLHRAHDRQEEDGGREDESSDGIPDGIPVRGDH
ncbi:hypothetical protein BC829DRAFT_407860 [Chytridium lagenaria]|nr:hypothetical protein BC829DRAFT_407860 [Chytridium lagenaria]